MKLAQPKKYKHQIKIIGEERIKELYGAFPKERISPSALMQFIEMLEIAAAYDGTISVEQFAEERGISPGKVYRAIKLKSE